MSAVGQPLFALAHTADGRSLTRALAVLLLFNALLGGFQAGAFAAAGVSFFPVLCTTATSDDGGHPASGSGHQDCCVAGSMAGCAPLPAALSPPAGAGVGADVTSQGDRPATAADLVAPLRVLAVASARGPPLSA